MAIASNQPTTDWPIEHLLAAEYDERAFLLTAADQSNRIEDVSIPWDVLAVSAEESRGHVGALAEAVSLARAREPLTSDHLNAWQAAILREQAGHGYPTISDEWIGRMRAGTCEVWVGTHRRHRGTPAGQVASRMAAFLSDLEDRLRSAGAGNEPLRVLSDTHLEYQDIHPYLDGSGRTARVLALYAAVRLGVSPVLFTHADKAARYSYAFWDRTGRAMYRYCARHQLAHSPFR